MAVTLQQQPQNKTGNAMFHYHVKMYMMYFTTETALYIPTTTFSIELLPERDHTKPHLVWHDTLVPTQRASGPASVSGPMKPAPPPPGSGPVMQMHEI